MKGYGTTFVVVLGCLSWLHAVRALSHEAEPRGSSAHESIISSSYRRGRYYVRPEEMGVKHCTLTGTLRFKQYNAKLEPVSETEKDWAFLAHFFLKAIPGTNDAGEPEWRVRGSGFFEQIPGGIRYRYIKMPFGLMQFKELRIYLENSWGRQSYPLKVVTTTVKPPHHTLTEAVRTFHVEAVVPRDDSYTLRMFGWKRGCFFSPELQPSHPPWMPLPVPAPITPAGLAAVAAGSKPPAFVVVMRHPTGLRPEIWAQLFEHHITYHRWLGVAAMIFYVRDNFLAPLLRIDSFRKLVTDRKIFLVRWDEFPPYPDDDLQVYDQHLLTAHATLAHWGEDVRLFHIDIDEWAVLPDPSQGNLADLALVGCLKNVTQAVFYLNDMGCKSCGDTNELDAWLSRDRYQVHPLEHYAMLKNITFSWPKVMVDPVGVFGHHVHDCLDLPGYRYTKVSAKCIWVFHLQQLFKKRYSDWNYYDRMIKPFDSFTWVFANPAKLV